MLIRFINSKQDLLKFEAENDISTFKMQQKDNTTSLLCFKGPKDSRFDLVYINKSFYILEELRA